MKKLLLIMIIALILSGCDDFKKEPAKLEMSPPEVESFVDDELTDIDSNNDSKLAHKYKTFSYLDQLSPEKQETLLKFKEEGQLSYLYEYTPEDMVVAYLYALSVGDTHLIYNITYDGGQLPEQDTFINEYNKYMSNHDSEIAVHYRYYDEIEIDKETAEENKVTVVVTTGVGIIRDSLALGLQKEDKVWKMDIYHLIPYFKEMNTST